MVIKLKKKKYIYKYRLVVLGTSHSCPALESPREVFEILFRVKLATNSDCGHFPHLDSPAYELLHLVVRYRVE